jgi:MscS family membrane protein
MVSESSRQGYPGCVPAAPKCRWGIAILLGLLGIGAGAVARAQQPSPTVEAAAQQPAGPVDEFDRGVPRTTMRGYLRACRDGEYERAAAYLDLSRSKPENRASEGKTLARHFKVILDHTVWVYPETLSDDPEGDLDDGLPPRRDRVETIHSVKGPVDILLERVPREDRVPIWKISASTVAKIPALYKEFGYGPLGDLLPEPLFEISFLQIELWQWIGLAAVVVVALVGSWLIAALIARMVRPLVARFRNQLENRLEQLTIGPVRLGIAMILFYAGSSLLALSVPVKAFLSGTAKALVLAAVTWLALRLVDIFAIKMEDRLVARGQRTALAVLPLGRRTVKVFLVIIASLALLQNFGFNVTGLLAGLGVGGLAVALAAQETVKNFFGGVALIADQPVRVGDFCRFGDKMGTVEDISLWSTRVRTLDRTVVSIPNGQFVGMQLENYSRRDRIWLHTTVGLHYDTTPDQLRSVLEATRKMLDAHPTVQPNSARVRFAGFAGPSLHIEIFAYILTASLGEFLAVREEIFLQIMDMVSATGCKFAPP